MSAPFLSKAILMFDYHKVDLSHFCEPYETDEELIEDGFEYIRKKFAGLEEVTSVEVGDSVTFSCVSEKPRFNKASVTVNAGKGLYSRELENKLIGKIVGQTATVQVGGIDVTVTIRSAQRRSVPIIDDAFVDSHFPGLHTVEDLREWYRKDQLEQYLQITAEEATNYMKEQVIANSEFVIDETERAAARAACERSVREMWEMNGIPLDTMTDEQAEELLGYPTAQSYIDWFADLCEQDVCGAVLGYEEMRTAGRELTLEQYQAELASMREETSDPDLELTYTFPVFARQKYSEYYTDLLKKHAYDYIKEKIK